MRKTRQHVFAVVCEFGVSVVLRGVWCRVPAVVLSGVPVTVAIRYSCGCGGCGVVVVVVLALGVRVAVVACSKIETSILVSRIGGGRGVGVGGGGGGGNFLLYDSPPVILIRRDFATFQEIHERVS